MRIFAAYITVCLAFALCMAAVAAEDLPAPPAPPAPVAIEAALPAPKAMPGPPGAPGGPSMGNRLRSVAVGPMDSQGAPRRVMNRVLVTAVLPMNARIVSVELFCNNALLGQKTQPPYQVEFDSKTVADGAHMFKAIGLSADGKQAWTAITNIDVRNSVGSVPNGPDMNTMRPGTTALGPNAKPKPSTAPPPVPVAPKSPVVSKPVAPSFAAGDLSLIKNYSSTKHGFSVRYPAGWVAKDQTTAMKPRKSGNAWVLLAPAKSKGATLAVNVRRMRLDPKSDADVFAKYNPYVTKWERKTALDSPAFATTTNVTPKKVIHRLIVIKNGCAWMLNCIDTSGQSPEVSQMLFDSVVNSLTIPGSTKGVGTSVTGTGKKH